jgi:hypothetical protein
LEPGSIAQRYIEVSTGVIEQPIMVRIGAWSIESFRAARICSGKRNGAQTLFSRANLPMKLGL